MNAHCVDKIDEKSTSYRKKNFIASLNDLYFKSSNNDKPQQVSKSNESSHVKPNVIPFDFTELPLDEKFVSVSKPEKQSVLHLKAIERQKDLIGKSTPLPLINCLPPPQEAPPEEYAIPSPPKSFVSIIQSILLSPLVRKEKPPFVFKTDKKSLDHNAMILKQYRYDLDEIIKNSKNNIISPGSEFRSPIELGPLLHSHPYWADYKDMMEKEVNCKFHTISEEQRL